MTYRVLDLFSGIGGFSLGLERTGGFRTVAFCEIDPFCRRVLAKHWPRVPQYDDVRLLTAERLAADGIAVDVICGGFPCQDISVAGKGGGLAGDRSGLWSEIARLAGELRPQYLLVENVAAILSRGLDKVLGDLAAIGYDAEWHCIPASAVGAPHRRDRFWLVADARVGRRCGSSGGEVQQPGRAEIVSASEALAYPGCERRQQVAGSSYGDEGPHEGWSAQNHHVAERDGESNRAWLVADADDAGCVQQWGAFAVGQEQLAAECSRWWGSEPDVRRMAHGVPMRVDRLRALGNAVVPQIPEMIGRAILAAE
jgi:DNA (cytosine-5)-methyltransferase 1